MSVLPPELESANTLLKVDKSIQKITDAIDGEIRDAINRLPKRSPNDPDVTCALVDGVVPADIVVLAIRMALLRIVFRALPSLIEEFISTKIGGFLNKTAAKYLAKRLASRVPFAGDIASAITGGIDSAGYMSKLEDSIHQQLSCDGGVRGKLNDYTQTLKDHSAHHAAALGTVATRNP
jgi:hypothetical protein